MTMLRLVMVLAVVSIGLIVLGYTAKAGLVTINVLEGNYVVPSGETRSGLNIRLLDPQGAVILEEGATLAYSDVRCVPTNHAVPGIIIQGVTRATLEVVRVLDGCGSDGIRVVDSSGVAIWHGEVRQAKGNGIQFLRTHNSEIIGEYVTTASLDSIALVASTANQIVATLSYPRAEQRGMFLDADSWGNQIVRSRARYNRGIIHVDHPDNLTRHSVCETAVGFTACVSDVNPVNDYGDPDAFVPKWWTACDPASFQNGRCDYDTPQEAVAVVPVNARIVVDSHGTAGWGNITIEQDGVWLVGNIRSQKGAYNYFVAFTDVEVAAPHVMLQQLKVYGMLTVQPDTRSVAIKIQ